MNKFLEFYNPVKVVSGKNSIQNCLASELKRLNANNILLISGPVINKLGITDFVSKCAVESGAKICAKYCSVPNESSKQTVSEICEIFIANNCDSILAVGGGSVLDTAKAVRLALSCNKKDLTELFGYNMSVKGRNIPFVAIPTTCGTGSEVTKVSVICDEDRGTKEEIISNLLLPDTAILDAKMLETLPKKSILLTAFDALAHAIEGYVCLGKNPLSDRYSLQSIRLIFDNLSVVISGNGEEENYLNLLKAATFAGISFSYSMVGGVHAIAHSAGSVLNVGHDFAVANLLPYVLKYNMEESYKEYAKLCDFVSERDKSIWLNEREKGEEFVWQVSRLFANNAMKIGGIPIFAECGLNDESIIEIANLALSDGAIMTNPKYLKFGDIVQILEMVKEGSL